MHLPKPYLGMGTWGMGGKYERDESTIEDSVLVLTAGMSLGLKIIDTAELYGEGLTEEIVGRAIKGRRDDVYLITKVWKTNLRYDDVLRAAEGSLKRLGTDRIDLYLPHYSNPEIPLSETMRAMERLVDEKLVGAIGVSNFTPALIEEAQHHLKHTKLVANQFEYNLLAQEADQDIIPYCRAQDIDMIAYRPFAKGVLAGAAHSLLAEIAEKYEKTPNQIVLNWILSQGMVAIPKSSNTQHLVENVGALGWELSPEDIDRLKAPSK